MPVQMQDRKPSKKHKKKRKRKKYPISQVPYEFHPQNPSQQVTQRQVLTPTQSPQKLEHLLQKNQQRKQMKRLKDQQKKN